MIAMWMKAVNMTSSFSKREKMRQKPFQAAKKPLDLVAFLVKFPVVFPRIEPGDF